MIYAVYPRAGETEQFRAILNQSHQAFANGSMAQVNQLLDEARRSQPARAIHVEACRAYAEACSSMDVGVVETALARLGAAVIASDTASMEALDPDILHDAYSLLVTSSDRSCLLAGAKISERAGAWDFLMQRAANHDLLPYDQMNSIEQQGSDYCIPRTGCFSYIEQIVLIWHYAHHFAVPVTINTINWNFPYPVWDFLPRSDSLVSFYSSASGGTENPWGRLTELLKKDRVFQQTFAGQKSRLYQHFLACAMAYLDSAVPEIDLGKTRQNVLYLRFGDKVVAETLPISQSIIRNLVSQMRQLTILSDDQPFADSLVAEFSQNEVETVYLKHLRGYYFANFDHDLESFHDAIAKWCVMASASVLYADTRTNFANAAFAANDLDEYSVLRPVSMFRPSLVN